MHEIEYERYAAWTKARATTPDMGRSCTDVVGQQPSYVFPFFLPRGRGEASPLMLMILLPPSSEEQRAAFGHRLLLFLPHTPQPFFPKVSPRVPNVMLLYSQGLSFLSPFFWLGGHGLARGADSLRR